MSKTITATLNAFICTKYDRLHEIKADAEKDPARAVARVAYYEGDRLNDYVRIGTATIELTLEDDKAVYQAELEELQRTLADVRADNQRRENAILDAISKLQAITYDAGAA